MLEWLKRAASSGRGKIAIGAVVAGVLLLAPLSSPTGVEAAKGGKNTSLSASTLTLNQTNPALGDSVTFSYSVPNGVNSPRIRMFCSQSDAGEFVFVTDGVADRSITLGGDGSWWLSGPASCHAELYTSSNHSFVKYATLDFAAAEGH